MALRRFDGVGVGLVAVLVMACACGALAGSCRESKLCCPGRDSSCVVQKAPINAIIEDLSDKPCYCDHACLKLGDCCQDFKDACGVVDCQMSSWAAWSSCTAECGPGRMTRTRTVERQPQNGGRRCAALLQTRGCVGNHCGHNHGGAAAREVAMLLPATFGWSRDANASTDIRRNLRLRYPKDPASDPDSEYCVPFEVIKATKACKKEKGFTSLREGVRVCVRCERQAMRKGLGYRCPGHGVVEQVTRWSALSAPHCHGKWVRLNGEQPEAPPPPPPTPDEDEDDEDLDDEDSVDDEMLKDSPNENQINEDKTHKVSHDKKKKKTSTRLSTSTSSCPACRDGALFIFV